MSEYTLAILTKYHGWAIILVREIGVYVLQRSAVERADRLLAEIARNTVQAQYDTGITALMLQYLNENEWRS